MNEEKAKAYIKRKGKPVTEENIELVQKKGKLWGDPVAECY